MAHILVKTNNVSSNTIKKIHVPVRGTHNTGRTKRKQKRKPNEG